MKMVPYDVKKLGHRYSYKSTENLRILEEFEKSGETCVRIEDFPQKHASSCYASLRKSIMRFHMNGISVFTRKGEVFLIRNKL